MNISENTNSASSSSNNSLMNGYKKNGKLFNFTVFQGILSKRERKRDCRYNQIECFAEPEEIQIPMPWGQISGQ